MLSSLLHAKFHSQFSFSTRTLFLVKAAEEGRQLEEVRGSFFNVSSRSCILLIPEPAIFWDFRNFHELWEFRKFFEIRKFCFEDFKDFVRIY